MNLISYIRLNAWRYGPTYWGEWARSWYYGTKSRWSVWRFWYSPIWRKTVRCSLCAGSGRHPKYGDECDDCHGAGFVPKWPGYHTPYWVYRLKRWIASLS